MRVVVESGAEQTGCRVCGVIADSHGRRDVVLVDVPGFGRPTRLVWRKRTWHAAGRPARRGRGLNAMTTLLDRGRC